MDSLDLHNVTAEQLATLLREAEAAHAEYERQLGHPDSDWPTWYARFILSRQPPPPQRVEDTR